MSEGELQHLVSMANDIGRNFEFHADGVKRIAAHMNRFWAPSMRTLLVDYARQGGEGLAEQVREAVGLVKT